MQYAPKKRVKEIITADLNLEPDDPLIAAADQLSEPETPKISERFNIKERVKKDAKEQREKQKQKKLEDQLQKLKEEQQILLKIKVSNIFLTLF